MIYVMALMYFVTKNTIFVPMHAPGVDEVNTKWYYSFYELNFHFNGKVYPFAIR